MVDDDVDVSTNSVSDATRDCGDAIQFCGFAQCHGGAE